MRKTAVVAGSILSGTLLLAVPFLSASEAGEKSGREKTRPKIEFRLSAYNGLRPLEIDLKGELKLPEPESMKSCLIQADWTNTTGVGLSFTTRDEIPCVDPKAEIKVPLRFEKKLILKEAGTYTYRVILEDTSGARYASASREVKVIESNLQIRVGKVVSDP